MKMNDILEAVRKKKVIRGGHKTWRKYSTREGYKVVNGKEVRIKSNEKRRRKLAARKASVKRRTSKSSANRSRRRSMRKRKHFHSYDKKA